MIVTHKCKINLLNPGAPPIIDVVQGDQYSRNIAAALHIGIVPWHIPEDTQALIAYCKADGKGGEYDTLPDGSTAVSIAENVVTVALAPQTTTVPGQVVLAIRLIHAAQILSTFNLSLNVHVLPGGEFESESYMRITGFLPQPLQRASVGQFLKISRVDQDGKVVEFEAVDQAIGPAGGYYTPGVSQPEAGKIQVDFTPSEAEMPAVDPVTVDLMQYVDDAVTTAINKAFAEIGIAEEGEY